jgi:hypothetical protein
MKSLKNTLVKILAGDCPAIAVRGLIHCASHLVLSVRFRIQITESKSTAGFSVRL